MKNQEVNTSIEVEVSVQEQKILEIMRNMEFGEVRLVISDGKPVRMEEIKKSVKL